MRSRIYAIGDIHGHLSQLEIALQRVHNDGGADAQIVFLGDYIDRGPESAEVIDFLANAKAAGKPWVMLKGNHDAYLPLFVREGIEFGSRGRPGLSWFDPILGGTETLASYGIAVTDRPHAEILDNARSIIPEDHIKFVESLPVLHETADLAFAHAGIRPGVPLSEQTEVDLTWIRNEFLDDPRDHGKLIVHGHTAVKYPEHKGNRVNLDGGAGWGRPIYPAVFEGRDAYLLTESGRSPLYADVGKS